MLEPEDHKLTITLIACDDFIADPKQSINSSARPMPEALSYVKNAHGLLASDINVSIKRESRDVGMARYGMYSCLATDCSGQPPAAAEPGC
jgi:hypothetical protein